MKNLVKVTALALAMSFSFMAANVDNDVSYASKQVQKLDLGVNMPNAPYRETLVEVEVNDKVRNQVIKSIEDIRAKAWDDNIVIYSRLTSDNPMKVRDFAEEYYNNPSKEAYIDEFYYSYDIERMAIQKAYELTLTDISDYRPDNFSDNTFYVTRGSGDHTYRYRFADSMAFNFVNEKDFTVEEFLEASTYGDEVYRPYDVYKNTNGAEENVVLPMLMSQPTPVAIGFAKVHNTENGRSAVVMAYAYDQPVGDKQDFVGQYKMSYGNPKYQPLPEATEKALKKAIKDAESQIAVVENLQQNFPKTISKVQDKLYKLLNDARATLEEAYGLVPVE